MGILPMSITGRLARVFVVAVAVSVKEEKKKKQTMGGTPMGLMAKMAMLHTPVRACHTWRNE
jgi:hypothetical protein